ncbi:MAG: Rpn family recombination-promoting nuclease/putative transposase, partial [Chitinispirillales bacterium]|nr:Rpn family recombination-promoting nuclease/putative transposase [Chitinispirillales bacterium]
MAATTDEPQSQDADGGEQNQKHDEGYKSILSDIANFLHLLRKYFRNTPWIAELLSGDIEAVRIDKSYITKEYRRVDSDLIYKLRKGGTDIYFYVLLELQSTVDYTMPFRLLRYMVELLNDIFQNTDKTVRERKDFRLPAIVPIVLYDGDNRWTAVRTYREYTEDYDIFGDNIINFKYLLLDLNRTDDEAILPVVKLLDAVFSLAK